MKNTYTLFLIISVLLTGRMNSQITSPSPYCAARIDANTLYYKDLIRAVNIGTLSNTTGTNYYNGSDYVYYNNITPVSLQKGATIPATFTISRTDIEMDLIWVYIDYNSNSSFDANELVGQTTQAQFNAPSSYGSSVTINFNINIPVSAQNGQTRMRVIYSSDVNMWSVTTPTACNSFTSSMNGPSFQYGEVEDYDVMIVSGSTVQAPSASFSVVSKACKNQVITLMDNSTNAPTAWSWTLTGATPSTSSVQNPTVTYATAGTYTILLSSSNAGGLSSVASRSLTINTCSGIKEIGSGEKINIYPNPGHGYFNVESTEPFQIIVYNVCGKKILEQNFKEGKQFLDLIDQPAGIYFITTFSKGSTQNLKLIKE